MAKKPKAMKLGELIDTITRLERIAHRGLPVYLEAGPIIAVRAYAAKDGYEVALGGHNEIVIEIETGED